MSIADVERVDDLGVAAWDQRDPGKFTGLLADGAVFRDASVPEPMTRPEQVRAYMQTWFTAFPDMRTRRVDRVVSETKVAGEIEFTGTHNGPLASPAGEVPATGRTVVGHGAYFAEVRDGRIVSFTAYPESVGLMAQLGLLPGAQQAPERVG
jgi:steroid delta-isomerase-like uncharacterized protein